MNITKKDMLWSLKNKKYSIFIFLLFLWYAERHKFLIK